MLPAPAATSVKYDSIKYNVSTTDNKFVGASPEVDKAWREISYDSMSIITPLFLVINRLNCENSGRPVDIQLGHRKTGHAQDVSKGSSSENGRRRLPSGHGSLPSAALHQSP